MIGAVAVRQVITYKQRHLFHIDEFTHQRGGAEPLASEPGQLPVKPGIDGIAEEPDLGLIDDALGKSIFIAALFNRYLRSKRRTLRWLGIVAENSTSG